MTRLEWSQVDLTRRMAWIHPDQAKAKKPIGRPRTACVRTRMASPSNLWRFNSASELSRHKKTGIKPVLVFLARPAG